MNTIQARAFVEDIGQVVAKHLGSKAAFVVVAIDANDDHLTLDTTCDPKGVAALLRVALEHIEENAPDGSFDVQPRKPS
jgi:hypothetical protein